jgi:hypothetical protein
MIIHIKKRKNIKKIPPKPSSKKNKKKKSESKSKTKKIRDKNDQKYTKILTYHKRS